MYTRSRNGVPPGPRGDGPRTEQQRMFTASHITTHAPIAPISSAKHHHYNDLLAWIVGTLSLLIFTDAAPAPPTISLSLSRRSAGPNTTASIVAGVLVSVFIVCVGAFFCVYGKSIRVRRRRHRHRHRRRASGTSKTSQHSDAAGGGGGGGGGGGDGGGEPVAEI